MVHLTVGADPFPPYQYIDKEGNVSGLDYDVVKSIIDKMGYKAEYVIKEWSTVEQMFNRKEIDIIFQVQKTPEREMNWCFSEKLRDAVTSIITPFDNIAFHNINEIFEKRGKLGVIQNYQYGEPIDSVDVGNKVYFNSLEELLGAANNNEVGFGVVDLGVFKYINKDEAYDKLKVIENLNFNRPLYVAFNSKFLRDEFNVHLRGYANS